MLTWQKKPDYTSHQWRGWLGNSVNSAKSSEVNSEYEK